MFGLKPVIEIGEHAPFFDGLNLFNDLPGDRAHHASELIPLGSGIREDNQEENGWFPSPVVAKRGDNADDIRRQLAGSLPNRRLKSVLIDEGWWYVRHYTIMS